MRRLVAEHLRRMERGGRWLPYSLGLMGLIAVGVLVLGAVTGSLSLPVFSAVLMIGMCCWILWTGVVNRRATVVRYGGGPVRPWCSTAVV
ncbi:hypothetical protein [Streptomyces sp. NPDC001759]